MSDASEVAPADWWHWQATTTVGAVYESRVVPIIFLGAGVAAASTDHGAGAVAGAGLGWCAAVGDPCCVDTIAGGCHGDGTAVGAVGVRKRSSRVSCSVHRGTFFPRSAAPRLRRRDGRGGACTWRGTGRSHGSRGGRARRRGEEKEGGTTKALASTPLGRGNAVRPRGAHRNAVGSSAGACGHGRKKRPRHPTHTPAPYAPLDGPTSVSATRPTPLLSAGSTRTPFDTDNIGEAVWAGLGYRPAVENSYGHR